MPVCITFDTERDFYSSQSYTSLGYKDKRFSMLEKAIPRLLKISDEYDGFHFEKSGNTWITWKDRDHIIHKLDETCSRFLEGDEEEC